MKRRIANAIAFMRRYIVNALAFLVIVGVGFAAFQSYDPPQRTVAEGVPTPDLKALTIVEVLFTPDKGLILIALEVPENTTSGSLIADILEIYRWSRSYYLPIKCGKDYPPQLCQIGQTEIYILDRSNVPVVGGTAEAYVILLAMGLDQMQIDRLLSQAPPETLNELFGFHEKVSQDTQGTGGTIQSFMDNPPLFQGFDKF